MVEKYIIMCGGDYKQWETPRHLSIICGEEIVARTIRLLRKNGITDIAISSNNPIFEKFGVPVLKHDNLYIANGIGNVIGDWFNAFYPTDYPVCYLFGDVVYSPEAIKKIIETKTDDIEFFGSQQPFASNYIKTHEEPFALKVVNTKHLKEAIEKTRELDKEHKFWRKPIVWELWTVIKNAPLQTKIGEFTADYVAINDYTCDVDFKNDADKLNLLLGGVEMIRCEVIEPFTLGRFDELTEIQRKGPDVKGKLFEGDTFLCSKELADYLTGGNAKNKTVVKVIEVIPEKTNLATGGIVNANPFVLKDNDEECIIPLSNKEELDKLRQAILKQIKSTKKKKSSKK